MEPAREDPGILSVVKERWCTGCGTCVACCPSQALEIGATSDGRNVPRIIEAHCAACGLCRDVCPAANENFQALNGFVFGSPPRDILLGHCEACFTGHSEDQALRHAATSGGAITTLLLFLLREGRIDGALLTRRAAEDPLGSEPFLARTEMEILSAMGSRYTPVALNTGLSQIARENGRFAVVGLPCHLQGVRRAEMRLPRLREKIAYHFGLTCSHTIGAPGVAFVLRKMGVAREEIADLQYRGGGWPSGLRIRRKDGRTAFVPNQRSWWSEIFGGFYFGHYYCTLCSDHFAEFSDLSFADAWLPEFLQSDNVGTSLIATRTPQGRALLHEAQSRGLLALRPLAPEKALQSQAAPVLFKKRNIRARMAVLRALGFPLPPNLTANQRLFLKPTVFDYLISLGVCRRIITSKTAFLRKILERTPFLLPRLGRAFYLRLLRWSQRSVFREG